MATNGLAAMKRNRPEALVALSLLAASAAAETQFEPRADVSQTYTSNVGLEPAGSEESEWITTLRPGFSLRRDGHRVRYDLDYDLQALYFAKEGDRNDVFHNFSGFGEGELIENHLFLDVDGRYEQRNIDPANQQATSNYYTTGNRTDVATLQISPWYEQPIGDVADATLRYTWSTVDYRNADVEDSSVRDGSVQDSELERASIGLRSPEEASWTWHVDYITATVSFDEAPDYKYETAGGELGIPIGVHNHLLLGGGRESNPVVSREDGGLDENWWSVGWQWRPTSRQDLTVRAGRRYYGPSYDASWQRTGSRGVLLLEYSESPTTSSAAEFDKWSVTPDGLFGQARIDTSVFLRKRLSGLLTWTAPRSDWSLRVFREQRDILDDGQVDEDFAEDEEVLGLRAALRWRAFVRTSVEVETRWEQQQFEEGDANTGNLTVALVRSLSPNLEGRLGITRLFKNSEVIDDYEDTAATVALAWSP
jgi:hypothetical protein